MHASAAMRPSLVRIDGAAGAGPDSSPRTTDVMSPRQRDARAFALMASAVPGAIRQQPRLADRGSLTDHRAAESA